MHLEGMRVDMKKRYVLVVFLTLFKINSFGHDQIVHQEITANAAASAWNDSPAYAGFINLISSDRSLEELTKDMVDGSYNEDYADYPGDAGGFRPYNHFYDPLDITYGKGLSDIPPDIRGVVGLDSFTWGSTSNCVGFNFNGVFGLGKNVDTMNIWSWPNAPAMNGLV
jgi:hypothetical protein